MLDKHMRLKHIRHMQLGEYLDRQKREDGLTEAQFGLLVGLSQSQVNRIRNGGKTTFETAKEIARKTEGAVTMADLGFAFEPSETAAEHAA